MSKEMTAMQLTLRTQRTAGILIGLAAAASAFGSVVLISTATAPAAHADDLTDILNGVESDFTSGQSAFADAVTDLDSSNAPGALAEFFTGVDDDFVLGPDSFYIGSVQALTGEPIINSISFGLGPLQILRTA